MARRAGRGRRVSADWLELRYPKGGRMKFLGAFFSAARTLRPLRIRTECKSVEELPVELKVLVDAKGSTVASGAGVGLGWAGGRALFARFALARAALGGALLGASVVAGLTGAFLRTYRFSLTAEPDAEGHLTIEGVPRLPEHLGRRR